MENLGELKRVIEVKDIEEVHAFYMDLEKTEKNLEEDLTRMNKLKNQKKEELKTLIEQLTNVQFDVQNNLVEDRRQADEGLQLVNTKLASIESEILHLQEPLDKILTCVGRMQNQLKSDGRVAELNIKKLREVLNEVSLKATSL